MLYERRDSGRLYLLRSALLVLSLVLFVCLKEGRTDAAVVVIFLTAAISLVPAASLEIRYEEILVVQLLVFGLFWTKRSFNKKKAIYVTSFEVDLRAPYLQDGISDQIVEARISMYILHQIGDDGTLLKAKVRLSPQELALIKEHFEIVDGIPEGT